MDMYHTKRFTSEAQLTAGLDEQSLEGRKPKVVSVTDDCVWVTFKIVEHGPASEYWCCRCTNPEQVDEFLNKGHKEGFKPVTIAANNTYVWAVMQRLRTVG